MFGAELRFYRTRAGLSQQDLAARATVSHDVISKIETGERPPAEDFPPRLDAVPELDTRGALCRLWDHLTKGQKQRVYGWFQQWAGIEAQATVLRWYEPLVVPGLLQTEDYARAILSARPDGNLDDLDEQVAARLARQAILGRTGAPQLWCILDEGVLRRAIGGSKVMRSQLYRLAEVAEHPRTTIQVIRSGGAHAGLLGGRSLRRGRHHRPRHSRPRQQAPERPSVSLPRRHRENLHRPAEGNRLTRCRFPLNSSDSRVSFPSGFQLEGSQGADSHLRSSAPRRTFGPTQPGTVDEARW